MLNLPELRHTVRGLRRTPGFTAVAVLTLAVGIGATSTVYSFVSAVFAASSPPDHLERFVALWSSPVKQGDQKGVVSLRDYVEWRRRAGVFDRVGAFRRVAFNMGASDGPVRASGTAAAGEYLDVVGERIAFGRGLGSGDEQPGAPRVVLLGNRIWRERFGAATEVLGRTVRLDGEPTTIVGVLAAKPLSPDLVVPLRLDPAGADYEVRSLFVFARRHEAVSFERARGEMLALGRALERERPERDRGWTINTRPLAEEFIGRNARIVFGILVAAVTAVLLIGCANIASLLLARGLARQRSLAIRSALGASRGRLAAQALLESGLVAAAGGVGGAAIGYAGLAALRAWAPSVSEVVANVAFGWRVVLFAAAAAAVAAVAAGLLPAFQGSRVDLERALREGSAGSTAGSHARRLRLSLVVGEVTLSVVLLFVAGLFLRTLVALQSVEPGFDARGVLTSRVTLPESEFPSPDQVVAFFERSAAAVAGHPTVVSASVASRVPTAGSRYNPNRTLVVEGLTVSGGEGVFALDLTVAPAFFPTLGIPLVEGRDFTSRDRAGAPLVAIVNRTMARKYWGGRSPVGGRLRLGDEPAAGAWRIVVGVVGDVRNDDIDEPPVPHVYVPLAQRPERSMTFVVRSRGDPSTIVPTLRAAVAGTAPDLPLYDVATLEEVVRMDLADSRTLVVTLALYACAALLLAAVGIGGVLAQTVSQRVPEIGIRIALGGSTAQVVWPLLRQALGGVGAGLLVGLGLATVIGRLISDVLFQVSPLDPVTGVAVVAALGASAAVAVLGPIRRAAHVDPVVALRGESGRARS
jgi:putative ABC transport system permease protein